MAVLRSFGKIWPMMTFKPMFFPEYLAQNKSKFSSIFTKIKLTMKVSDMHRADLLSKRVQNQKKEI